jgi:hydrogenase nickel incorporation protein HypA/HybF
MHELAICENIRSIIEEQAQLECFTRVIRVRVAVGPLSGVEPAALRFGFDVAMHGSVAAGAALEIVETAASAWCLACSGTVEVRRRYDGCPKCGSFELQILTGEELRIESLEVR